jgi:hypothetical protein
LDVAGASDCCPLDVYVSNAAWEEEFPTSTALKYARMGIAILENLSLRGSSYGQESGDSGSEDMCFFNAASIDREDPIQVCKAFL